MGRAPPAAAPLPYWTAMLREEEDAAVLQAFAARPERDSEAVTGVALRTGRPRRCS